MKRVLLFIVLSMSFWSQALGQDWDVTSNWAGIGSAGYSYYPYVNQSSLKLSFGLRYNPYKKMKDENGRIYFINDKGRIIKIHHDVQINLINVHYMFPNMPNCPRGSFGLTILGCHYRIGRARAKLCFDGEFLGISTSNNALGEQNGIVRITNSIDAGFDYYLSDQIILKVTGGVLARTFNFYLYPFVGISLSYEYRE